jgi:energy-coupling factor transporter transmembrane protein EcfT
MVDHHFLFPFREQSKIHKISSVSLTFFMFFTIVFLLINPRMKVYSLGFQLVYITSIFAISCTILLIFYASVRKIVRIVLSGFLIIFFLGLTSFFSHKGTLVLQIPIGNTSINFYSGDIELAILIWIRGLFSLTIISLYSTILTIQEFLQTLRSMLIPSILVTIIMLILRYTPLLYEQGREIRSAQELRGIKTSSFKNRFQASAARVGSTLIRSTRKGTEVYEAMLLRGLETSKFSLQKNSKWIFNVLFLALTLTIYLILAGGFFYWIQ